jgi:electron transfer flavoprotein beta subunit
MMRIIVPIKQVPETSNVKMDPITGTMIRTGLEAIINPLDLYAIETAIRLKEPTGGTITVISMGPQQAQKAIREAIAMGCDDGILLSDKAFSGADTWATAHTLSLGVQKLGGAELILCGERVGPAMAAMLDLPLVTYVNKIELAADGMLRVGRLVEGGREILSVHPPVLLTVVKEIAVPRLPTLRGIQRSKTSSLQTWGPEDISAELDEIGLKGSPTRVVSIQRPQVTRKGEMVVVKEASEVDRAAKLIVEFLKQRNIL